MSTCKFICGDAEYGMGNIKQQTQPIVEISEVNVKGVFTLTFSKEMDFSSITTRPIIVKD
jgi:hypothetical protein